MTIHLHDLIFHSFHGVYEEEQLHGNRFEVHVDVDVETGSGITDLSDTIDYVFLYRLIQGCMARPTKLLEKLASDMADEIGAFDKKVKQVSIQIKKINPPIEDFTGTVGISYKKAF